MFSTIILSAGFSSRAEQPKAFLKYNKDLSFLEHYIQIYQRAGIANIFIVVNSIINEQVDNLILDYGNVELILNPKPEDGRFSSILLGLQALKQCPCFIQNIDNPFVDEPLVNRMMSDLGDDNYVVPEFEGKPGHPVLLSENIVNYLSLLNKEANLREELNNFQKTSLEWNDPGILANVNTQEEYREYFPDLS